MFFSNPTALSQVILVAFTCFCCPGLFNALSSVAAGMNDPTVAYNGASLLYTTFAIFGLVGGGAVNVLGSKWTLFIGSWGYVLYVASLMVVKDSYTVTINAANEKEYIYTTSSITFFYIANAMLGVGAGFLWTAQGQMCMAYPTNETKGQYFSLFWIIFNLGATIGGFITFGTNYDLSNPGGGASTATYIVFIIVMALGGCLALVLSKPENVIRNDGTAVKVEALPDWRKECVSVLKLFTEPKMLFLFPLFAYSNWFYTYHSFYNVSIFNKRSGGFASAFYWSAQMIGAYAIGRYLDHSKGSRKSKAMKSLYVMAGLITTMWALGLWAQLDLDLNVKSPLDIDFTEGRFWVKFLLYFYYGFNDAICQVWSYWLMGQMSDDLAVLGRYAGYYKCVQSGMAAVSWKLGGSNVNPVGQLVLNWVLATIGLAGACISIQYYVEEKVELEYTGIETPNNKQVSSAIH